MNEDLTKWITESLAFFQKTLIIMYDKGDPEGAILYYGAALAYENLLEYEAKHANDGQQSEHQMEL